MQRLALFWSAVVCLALAVEAHQVPAESVCTVQTGMNVTTGTPLGPKKFVVSAQDCCNDCSNTVRCVGAVFASYYCTVYSMIEETAQSSTATLLSTVTTTTTTTRPPTTTTTTTTTTTAAPTTTHAPVPTTPAPPLIGRDLAFLTVWPDTLTCGDDLYPPTAEVVAFGTCSWHVQTNTYLSVENTTSGIIRKEYETATCTGTLKSETLYPWTCEYSQNMGCAIVAFVQRWDDQENKYMATSGICANQFCTGDCTGDGSFSGPTGTCTAYSPSSSSSAAGASSSSSSSMREIDTSSRKTLPPVTIAAQQYLCYPSLSSLVVFSYPSVESCNDRMPVVGTSLLLNACSFLSGYFYSHNTCQLL